jgi:hypothetical protein
MEPQTNADRPDFKGMTPHKARAAIILIHEHDGTVRALTDINVPLELDTSATRNDIKTACIEILDAIRRDDIIMGLISTMQPPQGASDFSYVEPQVEEAEVVE